MSTLLAYTLVTDPAPLETSTTGQAAPSQGAVYLLVSNVDHPQPVNWRTIEVGVPVGTGATDLTTNPTAITPRIDNVTGPTFTWQGAQKVFRATAHSNGSPRPLARGESMVLVLADIPVNTAEGVVALTIRENAALGGAQAVNRNTMQGLLKKAPKKLPVPDLPRNFRPQKSLVQTGSDIVLLWDGRDDLDYRIVLPDGSEQTASKGQWSPAAGTAPQRGATYTLVVSDGTQKYYLTTTVDVRSPTFDALTLTGQLTATGGTETPWVRGNTAGRKSAVTFTDDGVDISNNAGQSGVLHAEKAAVTGINTRWVQGPNTTDGWIDFTQDGVNVKNGDDKWGILHADKADVTGINTRWVQGRNTTDGWIDFTQDGVNVKNGDDKWGILHADKADVTGINTKWVQGRNTTDGWIDFPPHGVCVWQNGKHERGTVRAD
ncbi:hypothetical protein [Frankia sp. QA3]|uniref:hypothetical protein n=1 Tax=Frankia sp. QA3 TaxID=710111 RepID=UPI000269CC25|nr:hypothetical protein [Frankia sp. QA3]EIV96451.1 hypothetical protein FraQA3DRAFT_6350 [Frankia sp. QA3]